MISVVMTTYNGERYIIEQMDSIRKQSKRVDEVIICDDCSTDSTPNIVLEYIEKWHLENWTLHVNKNNLGWKKNFYYGLSLAKGDVVFFSDQDDVWNENKISKTVKVFGEYSSALVVCCTASFVDSFGKPIKADYEALPYSKRGEDKLRKIQLDNKFIYSIMPGCTMALKRSFIDKIYKIDARIYEEMPHDALFWKLAVIENGAFILNENLISYRIHDNNSSTPSVKSGRRVKSVNTRINEIDKNEQEVLIIKNMVSRMSIASNECTKLIEELLKFCCWRKKFVRDFNTTKLFSEIKYYRNKKMFLGDIACALLKH